MDTRLVMMMVGIVLAVPFAIAQDNAEDDARESGVIPVGTQVWPGNGGGPTLLPVGSALLAPGVDHDRYAIPDGAVGMRDIEGQVRFVLVQDCPPLMGCTQELPRCVAVVARAGHLHETYAFTWAMAGEEVEVDATAIPQYHTPPVRTDEPGYGVQC